MTKQKKVQRRKRTSVKEARDCVERIKNREGTYRSLAKSIQRSTGTIQRWVNSPKSIQPSARSVLTVEEEVGIVNAIVWLSQRGLGIAKKSVFEEARKVAGQRGVRFPSKSGLPSDKWWRSFVKRAEQRGMPISLRAASSLSRLRAKGINPETVDGWFKYIETVMNDKNILPTDIWNYDETMLNLIPSKQKIVCLRGQKSVNKLTNFYQEKTLHVSFQQFVRSNGTALTPTFIFPGSRRTELLIRSVSKFSPKAKLALTENGWIDSETNFLCFKRFCQELPPAEKRGFHLVLCDGHESHVQIGISHLAIQHKVEIIVEPPTSSHLLQALDRICFSVFKKAILDELMLNFNGHVLQIHDIPRIVKKPWDKAFSPQNIIKGFERAGIVPLVGSAAFSSSTFEPHFTLQAQAGNQEAGFFSISAADEYAVKRVKELATVNSSELEIAQIQISALREYMITTNVIHAIAPEQVNGTQQQTTYPLRRRSRARKGAIVLTGDEWMQEDLRQKDELALELKKKEERKKEKEKKKKEKEDLQTSKKPCQAVLKNGTRKGKLCGTLSDLEGCGKYLCGFHKTTVEINPKQSKLTDFQEFV